MKLSAPRLFLPWICGSPAKRLARAFRLLATGLVVPVLGLMPVLWFPFDFVFFAYVWGTGRFALMLGAFDVVFVTLALWTFEPLMTD